MLLELLVRLLVMVGKVVLVIRVKGVRLQAWGLQSALRVVAMGINTP